MAFKSRSAEPTPPSDPEGLYRTLAGRGTAPPALWAHQADLLRVWHAEHVKSKDVALELPTGAGKTLVGGLISDWRRRHFGERVAYLCPTRQLAAQTAERLQSYGIPVVLLTGRAAAWNQAQVALYGTAKAVAVSVYSHIFNSNPAIDDAQVLVFDDAHTAESYVASAWSLEIDREDKAYQEVLSVIAQSLDPLVVEQLRADSPPGQYASTVHLAAPDAIRGCATELETLLRQTTGLSRAARYTRQTLEGNLDRCMCYVTYRGIQFRPLIPPTGLHPAFDLAGQRIYMSATLGSGGELERSFGRSRIERIPVPKGWDRQGTGRRFFCFPELTTDLSRSAADVDKWVNSTIARQDRAVVLAPDRRTAHDVSGRWFDEGVSVLRAEDVERNLAAFSSAASKAVLLLTNRYDGIDLPDDQCRLVILHGLPARGDLQERFLHRSVGAVEVLQERLRARIAQGAGRATRNSGDYSVVVVTGSDLVRFCSRADVQAALHPEVHAEIKFGFEQSLTISSEEMTENVRLFLDQTTEWAAADVDIQTERDGLSRVDPPGASELERSAPKEVQAWLACWQGEWQRALELCREAIDALRGGRAPQRHAALLNYIASDWSARLAEQSGDSNYLASHAEYVVAARAAARGTTWIPVIPSSVGTSLADDETEITDPLDQLAAETVSGYFETVAKPARFDRIEREIEAGLAGRSATEYEAALVELGRLLGADSAEGNGGASAAPDAWWGFGDQFWVCWEAKSEAKPDGEVSADDVRQAGTHLQYVSASQSTPIPGGSVCFLVTPQVEIHPAAHRVAQEDLYMVSCDEAWELLEAALACWRELRSRSTSHCGPTQALSTMRQHGVAPSMWVSRLAVRSLRAGADSD